MNNYKIHNEVSKAIKKGKRKVIIHRHIFKNAGTTFDFILRNNFGSAFCDHRNDIPMRKEGEKYLLQSLKDNPEVKALSSHHIWFNPKSVNRFTFVPIIFIRHPIERIRSVYNFERQQQANTSGALIAKKLDFKEYVSWFMQDNVSAVIRNIHTRYLAGVKKPRPLDNKQFRVALKFIEKSPFIGVVDLFDQSLKNFDKAFRAIDIELDFSYENKNVSQPFENADYELRAREVLDELNDIAAVVLEKNAFDLKLYKIIRERVLNCKFHRYAK